MNAHWKNRRGLHDKEPDGVDRGNRGLPRGPRFGTCERANFCHSDMAGYSDPASSAALPADEGHDTGNEPYDRPDVTGHVCTRACANGATNAADVDNDAAHGRSCGTTRNDRAGMAKANEQDAHANGRDDARSDDDAGKELRRQVEDIAPDRICRRPRMHSRSARSIACKQCVTRRRGAPGSPTHQTGIRPSP